MQKCNQNLFLQTHLSFSCAGIPSSWCKPHPVQSTVARGAHNRSFAGIPDGVISVVTASKARAPEVPFQSQLFPKSTLSKVNSSKARAPEAPFSAHNKSPSQNLALDVGESF